MCAQVGGVGRSCWWCLSPSQAVGFANNPRLVSEWWWCWRHASLSGGDFVRMKRLGVGVGLGGVGRRGGWWVGVTTVVAMAEGLGTGVLSWPSVWASLWSWTAMWVALGLRSGGRPRKPSLVGHRVVVVEASCNFEST
jgi:hypothetical protein